MRGMLVACLGAMWFAGCGAPPAGGGGGGAAPAGALSGDWTLVHNLNPLAGMGAPTVLGGTLRLVQNGTALTGTYSPSQVPTAMVVSGSLSGGRVSLQIGPVVLASGVTLNLRDAGAVEASARAASGSTAVIGVLGGTTLQSTGTFTMTRQ